MAGLANGRRVRYDALVCTAPLDATLRLLGRGAWADALTHRCPRPARACAHTRRTRLTRFYQEWVATLSWAHVHF